MQCKPREYGKAFTFGVIFLNWHLWDNKWIEAVFVKADDGWRGDLGQARRA